MRLLRLPRRSRRRKTLKAEPGRFSAPLLTIQSLDTAKAIVGLPPDSLQTFMALANSMRLSLMKAAHADVGGAPWQEIRVARRFRPTYAPRHAGAGGGERGAPVQGTRLAVGRPKPLASSKNYPAQASLDKRVLARAGKQHACLRLLRIQSRPDITAAALKRFSTRRRVPPTTITFEPRPESRSYPNPGSTNDERFTPGAMPAATTEEIANRIVSLGSKGMWILTMDAFERDGERTDDVEIKPYQHYSNLPYTDR